jgi:hypothetical protein
VRFKLDFFHTCLGNCHAVAAFLGYSRRGYMKVRRQILCGEPITKRTQVLLEKKFSELRGRQKLKSKGVAQVPLHIKPYRTEKSAACHKEFDKCRRKIQSMLLAGKSRTEIYRHLTGAGRLTMSYSGFCRFVTQAIDDDPTFLALAAPSANYAFKR